MQNVTECHSLRKGVSSATFSIAFRWEIHTILSKISRAENTLISLLRHLIVPGSEMDPDTNNILLSNMLLRNR